MTDHPSDRGPILIVDEDAEFRTLASGVLGHAGHRVCELPSGEAALESIGRERPVLVILEVRLPGLSGYEVCRELKEEFGGELPILFVSRDRTESFDRVAGLIIGGDDYLVKPVAPDELLARVRGLLRRSNSARAAASKLTARELEVLRLLARGLAGPEIARELVISPKTVRTHIEHILRRLGVHTRAHAVAEGYRLQLIEPRVEPSAAPVRPDEDGRGPESPGRGTAF